MLASYKFLALNRNYTIQPSSKCPKCLQCQGTPNFMICVGLTFCESVSSTTQGLMNEL